MQYAILTLFVILSVMTTSSAEIPSHISKPSKPMITGQPTIPQSVNKNSTTPHAIQPPVASQIKTGDSGESVLWVLWRFLAPLLLGGVGAAIINIYWTHRTRKREYAGLIIVLSAEFVTALNRCVTYYDQSRKGEISYSSLFVLSDASVLSKFASLVGKAELVIAAINLKSHFFQIERHVEIASRCIMEFDSTKDTSKGSEALSLLSQAQAEQGAAVGFFLSPYDEIVRDLSLLLKETDRLAKGSVAKDLRGKFQSAIEKKMAIDGNAQTGKQNPST